MIAHTTCLPVLDVSRNRKLRELGCVHNQLTRLDLTNNTALEILECYENYMGDDPAFAISGLAPLLPKLGAALSKGDKPSGPFLYYPQENPGEAPVPSPTPTPTPSPSPTPTPSPEPTPTPTPSPTPTPTPSPDETNPFTDVRKNDWFYDEVMAAYRDGLMLGISESKFAPQTEITRGMFVTVLYRMEGEPQTALAYSFTDVPENEYFANAVAWASKNGIVKGYSERKYAPDQAITREEMAAVIYRYANYKGLDMAADQELAYTDGDSILTFAVDAVRWVTENQIMQGDEEKTFRPRDFTIRAEAAMVFGKVYALLK